MLLRFHFVHWGRVWEGVDHLVTRWVRDDARDGAQTEHPTAAPVERNLQCSLYKQQYYSISLFMTVTVIELTGEIQGCELLRQTTKAQRAAAFHARYGKHYVM